MTKEQLEILRKYLGDVAVIKNKDVGHKVEIKFFKTHFPNGNIFKHQDGNNYGITIFNAITDFSEKKIIKYINDNPDIKASDIIEFSEELLLSKYVYSNSDDYSMWCDGDIGLLQIKWNNDKRIFETSHFFNATAMERNKKIRELIPASNERNKPIERDYSSREKDEIFNSDFYNDQLDMDQQSPEFWDSL